MQILFILLYILHSCHLVVLNVRSYTNRWFFTKPQPLLAPRRRIPNHLAILFATDSFADTNNKKIALTESVLRAVDWCRTIGVKKLTVYEEKDLISQCMHDINSAFPNRERVGEEYRPPTPPSDCTDSGTYHRSTPVTTIRIAGTIPNKVHTQQLRKRNQSTLNKDFDIRSIRNDLLLCVASRAASKPAIASAAQALAQKRGMRTRRGSRSQKVAQAPLTIDELNNVLEDEDSLSSPDFMIIHHFDSSRRTTPELHGFPPWHIRLTEIFHHQPQGPVSLDWLRPGSPPPRLSVLDEITFRAALDEFAGAEMRFGK